MKISERRPNKTGALASCQRGVAAIEFALVFTILFGLMYSIATFGAVLYIQQAISRAAEDGARAVTLLPATATFGATEQALIQNVVYDSLAGALIVPNSAAGDPRKWVSEQVDVKIPVPSIAPGSSYKTSVLTVTYPYSANRLLPSIPIFDISRWMPTTLIGRATVTL